MGSTFVYANLFCQKGKRECNKKRGILTYYKSENGNDKISVKVKYLIQNEANNPKCM